jgi:G3E family GTPase
MRSSKQAESFSSDGKARYIMVGGFLGAGKTTAVARLAQHLVDSGCKVGLITNDQGQELVDTAMLRSRGFDTEEISGGCFCCRFNSLTEAAQKLSTATRPDVFIAEPVGSCTDLIATVSYPLRRIYGRDFVVSPLSVLVDPVRASQIFGQSSGRKFSDKVAYIYKKQLEEADIIVINKCDAAERPLLSSLRAILEKTYPSAAIVEVSARTGEGLEPWFDRILHSDPSSRHAMQVDYDLYAEGEALLGWMNCAVRLSSRKYFDSGKVLMLIAEAIQNFLAAEGAEIAHLKMTLNPDEDLGDLAVINLVRNDYVPELSQTLPEPIESGELIINLRAETDPEFLNTAVNRAIVEAVEKTPTLFARMEHSEHFRPGKPQPTHRVDQL